MNEEVNVLITWVDNYSDIALDVTRHGNVL